MDHTPAQKWRTWFGRDRLDGLLDEPRPGRPRTVSDAQVEEVIINGLEPRGHDALVDAVDRGRGRLSPSGVSPNLGRVWTAVHTARRRGALPANGHLGAVVTNTAPSGVSVRC